MFPHTLSKNGWKEVLLTFCFFRPVQFFSTLFAPLGFFADKMENFMPSSFWHQLTRIWPHPTQDARTYTHTPIPLQTLRQKVFALLSSALLSTCCIVTDYVGWGCINTAIPLWRCSPTLFQRPKFFQDHICNNFTGSFISHYVSTGQFEVSHNAWLGLLLLFFCIKIKMRSTPLFYHSNKLNHEKS